ncbi:MAG: nuclear transport factor 2 family protein [Actinomycetota bacterium]|nr:nuclear transport factor 2 family protein [Actinomycetota bacterium]
MASTIAEIGQAFSEHRFAEVYPHLAPEVRWELIGGSPLTGRDAVIAACEESLVYLSQATTDFRKFRSVVGTDAVVVDSLAEYSGADGQTSVVASCDIYDFVNGEVTTITSYTVEVGEDQDR